jgi:hypothetical protein
MDRVQVLITRDSQWKDLSRFMSRFTNLQELTWGCEEQIPASVFRGITPNNPGLRLHIKNFKLRYRDSLPESPIILDLDPYSIELATSPCLYSLTIYAYNDLEYDVQHAIMDMLAGAAPNLREAKISFSRSRFRESEYPEYRRGDRFSVSPSGQGVLQYLSISMRDSQSALRAYSSVTSFSMLKSLKILHDGVSIETLHFLTSAQLDNLEHISLYISESRYIHAQAATKPDDSVTSLIASLPALQSLDLGGMLGAHTLSSVLGHCGHRLRCLQANRLMLDDDTNSVADLETVQKIKQKCPQLEELTLVIPRSKGDAKEVAIYCTLGALVSLRKIRLILYNSQFFPEDLEPVYNLCLSGRTLDQKQQAELDDGLMNFAIDQQLARSIFRTISTSKPAFSTPLECVTIEVDASFYTDFMYPAENTHLECVLKHIGRSWTCTRNPRDNTPHDCFVTDYNPVGKDARGPIMGKKDDSFDKYDLAVAQAVCRVWPAARTKDWKDVWHSFELDTSSLQSNLSITRSPGEPAPPA